MIGRFLQRVFEPEFKVELGEDEDKETVASVLDKQRSELFKAALTSVRGHEPRKSFFTDKEMEGRGEHRAPSRWRVRVSLLHWWADQLRDEEPVKVAHVYRPEDYNKEVGGAPDSAHVHCCAIDLDFSSRRSHRFALDKCRRLFNSDVNWGIGVGVGGRRIHVDFYSPSWSRVGRPRLWFYDSRPDDIGNWRKWK